MFDMIQVLYDDIESNTMNIKDTFSILRSSETPNNVNFLRGVKYRLTTQTEAKWFRLVKSRLSHQGWMDFSESETLTKVIQFSPTLRLISFNFDLGPYVLSLRTKHWPWMIFKWYEWRYNCEIDRIKIIYWRNQNRKSRKRSSNESNWPVRHRSRRFVYDNYTMCSIMLHSVISCDIW